MSEKHEFSQIQLSVSENIATITLNRPEKLNAFTNKMLHEIIAAFDLTDADDDVRAVIVTGAGRAFCAGADLSSGGETFSRGGSDVEGVPGVPRDGGGLVSLRIFNSKKPVIGAINGPAVGVGVTMTLPMDIRLASNASKFGFVFTRRGVVTEACSSWFLPRVVGWCVVFTPLKICYWRPVRSHLRLRTTQHQFRLQCRDKCYGECLAHRTLWRPIAQSREASCCVEVLPMHEKA